MPTAERLNAAHGRFVGLNVPLWHHRHQFRHKSGLQQPTQPEASPPEATPTSECATGAQLDLIAAPNDSMRALRHPIQVTVVLWQHIRGQMGAAASRLRPAQHIRGQM